MGSAQRHRAKTGARAMPTARNEKLRTANEIANAGASTCGIRSWKPKYAIARVGTNESSPHTTLPQTFPNRITQRGVGVAKICSRVPFQRSVWRLMPPSR